jgi:hypothetical protein
MRTNAIKRNKKGKKIHIVGEVINITSRYSGALAGSFR